jgi:hypothetical protein
LPVVQTTASISNAVRAPGIAIRFRSFLALGPGYQKLLPHFSEARTAIFSVKQVEDDGHESNLLFDYLGVPSSEFLDAHR